MSGQAVQNQLAPICVHQFNEQANRTNRLEALRKLAEWKREKFVDDGGWATMPGSDSSVSGVARLCAANLIKA